MGTLVGHVAPGFAFFALGFWHLFNHIKLYSIHPNSYKSYPWFPTSKLRYIEPFLIILCSSISISMELFIGPKSHQPLDPDGTIPSNHLHNFEHSAISMTFFTYAAFAILLDKISLKSSKLHQTEARYYSLTQFLGSVAFAQQLFLFHLHSADHMGVEGQYHLLLQIPICVSLATTLMGIGLPKCFMLSFIRSLSILYQGLWLIVIGYMLWTPALIPKGCFIHLEEGHQVVRCSTDEALHRAKSLVNIQFSWALIVVTVFAIVFYLVMERVYGEKVQYWTLAGEDEQEKLEEDDEDDVESQKPKSLINVDKRYAVMDIER